MGGRCAVSATQTPLGAYAETPHKTTEELVAIAARRAIEGENPSEIIQDIVDGYNLGWQSANHQLIDQAARNPLPYLA